MRMMRNTFLIHITLLCSALASAQEVLTLKQAIDMAIQQNFEVRISENTVEITENNATRGNAGQLPRLAVNSSATYNNQNTELEFAGGIPPASVSGAQSTRATASLDLSYTIFAGRGNHYTFQRLQNDVLQSDIELKRTIENTIVQLTNAYVNITALKKAYGVAERTVEVSLERYKRLKQLTKYGQASHIDVLNAEVNLQSDSSTLRNTALSLRTAKRDLNTLLSRDIETDFEVSSNVTLQEIGDKTALIEGMKQDNLRLLATSTQLTASEIELNQARSRFYPSLSTNISYGYANNRNETGILLVQNQLGLSAGLTLQFTLFDGLTQKRSYENSQLRAESQLLTKQQLELELMAEMNNAYDRLEQAQAELKRERRNSTLATENLERTQGLLRLGQVNSLQFREAQLNQIRVEERIIQKENQLVIAKLELLRLSGALVTLNK